MKSKPQSRGPDPRPRDQEDSSRGSGFLSQSRRSSLVKGRSAEQEGSRCGPVRVSTACPVCAKDLGSHMELFRHAVTHLEPGVDKTLPVYEDGDTGWCPHCSGPVVVEYSEEHVLDKHPELVIPGTGSSRVTLPELQDELSPHLSDEETRILARLKACFVKLNRVGKLT